MRLLTKKVIMGCDSRGDGESPYLTRICLIETRFGAAYIHKFHRSDADEHHDHPWAFASLILWRGYEEETPTPDLIEYEGANWTRYHELVSIRISRKFTTREQIEYASLDAFASNFDDRSMRDMCSRKRKWPGMVLFRRATHRHRVVLIDGKPAWTLVIRGPYVRDWGFFTYQGWQRWKEYFKERGC